MSAAGIYWVMPGLIALGVSIRSGRLDAYAKKSQREGGEKLFEQSHRKQYLFGDSTNFFSAAMSGERHFL